MGRELLTCESGLLGDCDGAANEADADCGLLVSGGSEEAVMLKKHGLGEAELVSLCCESGDGLVQGLVWWSCEDGVPGVLGAFLVVDEQ